MSISVLILALDEELTLPRCLESVSWSDDIIVLDSGSTDRTVEIAKTFGARVVTRPFDDERTHRTYSLREIEFRHPWVYNPDADEVTPAELRDEMLGLVADACRPEVAYSVRFKTMFMGLWIKHASMYPTWVMRLFGPEKIRLERSINLTYLADGPVGRLRSHFLHYSFASGLSAWREKHLRYASIEAEETLKDLRDGRVDWAGLVSHADPVRRRRALKGLSFRLPCRPLLRLIYMYFLRMGFLDGYPGFKYCRLMAWYESRIAREIKRLQLRQSDCDVGEGKAGGRDDR